MSAPRAPRRRGRSPHRARRAARRPRPRPPDRLPSCRRLRHRSAERAPARDESGVARARPVMSATHRRHVSSHGVTASPDGRGGRREVSDRSTCSSGACACRVGQPRRRPRRGAGEGGTPHLPCRCRRRERLVEPVCVRDSVEAVAVDELDIEFARLAAEEADVAPPVPDHGGALVREVPRAARARPPDRTQARRRLPLRDRDGRRRLDASERAGDLRRPSARPAP